MQRDRFAGTLISLAIFVAPLLLGGAPRWATLVACGLCIVTVVPYLGSSRRLIEGTPLFLFFAIACGLCLLQLAPLPLALLELLSPLKAELLVGNAKAMGSATPGFGVISVDPPATLLEAAKFAAYGCLVVSARRAAKQPKVRYRLAVAVAGVGLVVAAIGVLHELAGIDKLFGVYAPVDFTRPRILTSLLNRNHLAGLLALSCGVSVGLAMREKSLSRRAGWLAAVAVMFSTGIYAGSKAGAVAMLLAIGIAGILHLIKQNGKSGGASVSTSDSTSLVVWLLSAAAVVLAGAAAFALFGADLLGELSSSTAGSIDGGRWTLWRSTLDLSSSYWLTGIGRGAFEPAFTPFNTVPQVTFARAENEFLQTVADWGVPMAAFLGVYFARAAVHAWKAWRASSVAVGALAGVTALVLHNAVDFSLELPGVAVPAVATATLASTGRLFRGSRRTRLVAIGWLGLASLLLGLAASPLGRPAREHLSDSGSSDAMVKAWNEHPGDYRFAAYVARNLASERDGRAVAVLNRVFRLHPNHAAGHEIAAYMLLGSQRRSQALVEFRLAIRLTNQPERLLAALSNSFPDPTVAVDGLPVDDAIQAYLLSVSLENTNRAELALEYLARAAERHPKDTRLVGALLKSASRHNRPGLARSAGWSLLETSPNTQLAMQVAALEKARGRYREGLRALALAAPRAGSREWFMTQLTVAELNRLAGDFGAARRVLMVLLADVPPRDFQVRIFRELALAEDGLGNPHRADWARRNAKSSAASKSLDSSDL